MIESEFGFAKICGSLKHLIKISENNAKEYEEILRLEKEITQINSCPERSEIIKEALKKLLSRKFKGFIYRFISKFGLTIESPSKHSGSEGVYYRTNGKFEVVCEGVKILNDRKNVLDGWHPIFVFELTEHSFYAECYLRLDGPHILSIIPEIMKGVYNIIWRDKRIGLRNFDFLVSSGDFLENAHSFAPINLLTDFFEAQRGFCEMMGSTGLQLIYEIVVAKKKVEEIIKNNNKEEEENYKLNLIKDFTPEIDGLIIEIIKKFSLR